MNEFEVVAHDREPMVDARTVSAYLGIPLHYLLHRLRRKELGVPHYRIGRLLRFRMSEMESWKRGYATVMTRLPEPADGG